MSDLIARHLRDLRAGGFARSTIEFRRRLLHHADRHLPYGLDEADRDDLAEYLGNDDWSDWTRHTYDAHLRGYYGWGVEVEELTINPMIGMRHPRSGECLPDPVTDDELAYALANSPPQPWRMATMLAAYAGLRGSEIARLRREDVNEDNIRVRQGKGNRDALIETAPLLWEYVRGEPAGHLVRTAAGAEITGIHLIAYQRFHWRGLGMPDVHLHRFRHWYATALLRAGNDLRVVQELMRHKSIVSTQGYTQVVSAQRGRAVRSLPRMGAPASL